VDTAQPSRVSGFVATVYAAFFNFAHLARCSAVIFLRADADIALFTGAEPVIFAAAAGCDPFRVFAHRAF
jgi:hypothetical protein